MSDLHLIEMPLKLCALHRWAEGRKLSARGTLDEGRALHHLFCETFGPAALQPFRLMVAPGGLSGTGYAYAGQDAGVLRDLARAAATPAAAGILALDRMRSLPRPVRTWQTGQRLGFDLRLRPVVRLRAAVPDTAFRKGGEIDAFLAEALQRHGGNPDGMKSAGRGREAVYLDWLNARLGAAATLDREGSRLASFRRSRVHRGGRLAEGPDAVIHGALTVTDPDRFAERLARGVGRHRAYGYGMLLLRPPRRC